MPSLRCLQKLRERNEKEVLDSEECHNVMRWFGEREFYLAQERCEGINEIKNACNNKEKGDPYRIFVLWNDATPNQEMSDSYFENG